MDGDDVSTQPSERPDQASALATVLAFLSSFGDWYTASNAYMAATAIGTELAARGDTPYPENFNPGAHPGRFGSIGPRGRAPSTDVMAAMDWASGVFGLKKDYTQRIIYLESAHTFDPNITNPSGAKGLGQFFAGTWDSMMEYIIKNKPEAAREWLKKRGIITDPNASDRQIEVAWRAATMNPTPGTWSTEIWRDADLNALATVAYADHNRAILVKMGVKDPTVGQIYAMHLFGEGDGAKLIRAMLNGQSNVDAARIVSPRSLRANHLSGQTVGQVMASLDGWMASMPDLNSLPPAEGLPVIAGNNASTAIGMAIGARTDQYSNTPYQMGGNALGPHGGIDCSHYAWNDTIAVMREINAKVGTQIYDIKQMAGLMAPSVIAGNGRLSASQYEALKRAGYTEYSRADITSGRLAPGTLIFVDHGRGIEHVAQVSLDRNGHLQISQSGGSNNHRVNNETYEHWMRAHASARLTAINPFEVKDQKLRETLEAAFKPADPLPKPTEVAFRLAPPGHDVTIGDSYMCGIQAHLPMVRPEDRKGTGGKTMGYLADRVEDNVGGGRIVFHSSVWNDLGQVHVQADGSVKIDPVLRRNAERVAAALEKNGGVWILPLDQSYYAKAHHSDCGVRIAAVAQMYKEIAAEHHVPTIDINDPNQINYHHTADIHIGPRGYEAAAAIVQTQLAILERQAERQAAAKPATSPSTPALAEKANSGSVAPPSPQPAAEQVPPVAPQKRDWAALRNTALAAAVDAATKAVHAAFDKMEQQTAEAASETPNKGSARKVREALQGSGAQQNAANDGPDKKDKKTVGNSHRHDYSSMKQHTQPAGAPSPAPKSKPGHTIS